MKNYLLIIIFLISSLLSQEIGKPFANVGHWGWVKSFALIKNKFIVSGGEDAKVKLWDLKTGRLIKELYQHNNIITSITVSINNRYILSGSFDKKIIIYDLNKSKIYKTINNADKFNVNVVKVSNDTKYIYSAGGDEYIKIWDFYTGKLLFKLKGHSSEIEKILLCSNNKYLISESNKEIIFWNLNNRKIIKKFKKNENDIFIPFFKKNNMYLLVSNKNKSFIYDIKNKTKKPINLNFLPGELYISYNNRYLLYYQYNKLFIYNIEKNFKNIYTTKETHFLTPMGFYISNNGKYIFIGSNKGDILIYKNKKNYYTEDKIIKGQIKAAYPSAKIGKNYAFIEGFYDNSFIFDLNKTKIVSNKDDISSSFYKNKAIYYGQDNKNNCIKYTIYTTKNKIKIKKENDKYCIIGASIENNITLNIKNGGFVFRNLTTGKKLLTLYKFKDGEWVAITPQGYFNASKNGAKHLNILTAPLKVTSIDAFYEKFYRPDIVKLALQGKSVDTGLKIADIKPAPSIEIINTPHKTNKDNIKITLRITDEGGGIGNIRVYLNGVAIKSDIKSIIRREKKTIYRSYNISLKKGKNIITAIAFDSTNSVKSDPPAKLTITANYTKIKRPTLYALLIGIDKFENSRYNLHYAKSDALELEKILKEYAKPLFKNIKVTTLTTKEQTTKESIIKALKSFQNINPNDMFLFFVSSHGVVDSGEYFLATSSVKHINKNGLKQDALSQDSLTNLISNIPTNKKLILLDTCHAGALGKKIYVALMVQNRGLSEDTAIKVLSRATGTTVISASLSYQQALEGYKNHGIFSYALIEGLKGKADNNKDSYVKVTELLEYIDEQVSTISKELFNQAQYPAYNSNGQTFPITKVNYH